MATIDQLVAATGGGPWKLKSRVPVEETAPQSFTDASRPGAPPQTVNRGTGRYYIVIADNEGHERALFLKADPIKGGLEIQQTGVNDTIPDETGTGTKPNPSLYTGDLTTISWSQAGPVGDVPQGPKTPTPAAKLKALDATGREVPIGDPSARQMHDDATGTTFNLVTDPAGAIHDVGNEVWLVKPDGSHTVVGTKPNKPDTINVPGVGLVEYDPTKPAGSRTTTVMPVPTDVNNLGGIQVRNGKSYVPSRGADGSISFLETNLPANQEIGYTFNDPNSKWIIFYDKQGTEVSRTEKPDWKAEPKFQAGQAGAADNVSAMVPSINPQTGALEFVPNGAQIKASEATAQLAQSLGVQVAAGSMSEKQAQDLITSAIARMNAETQQAQVASGAAQNILSTQAQGAQTGAGMLQQRATTAQNLVQQGLNVATSAGGRYGNYSGGMLSPVPGLGQNLVQGAAGFATELGGGQAVYDTAVRMVQAADPNNSNPDRAAAVATLTQLMDRYQQAAQQDHPAVAATKAAQQSQQGQGFVSPAAVSPEVFQAQFDPRFNPAAPQQPGGTVLPAGVAGTVAPGSAQYLGTLPTTAPHTAAQLGFTAPGAIMGMVGPMAMAANR